VAEDLCGYFCVPADNRDLNYATFFSEGRAEVALKEDINRRIKNEKKFETWKDLPNGGRVYCYEVKGHHGWTARYVKEVDTSELTVRFYQEIYNNSGQLVEVHEKYPIDKGHERVEGGKPYED